LHNKTKHFWQFYKTYWFLIWFVVYGLLFYLSTLLTSALHISNTYFQIIFIGVIISLFARIISCSIHKRTFHLSFNLLIWTLVYILLLFGMKYILTYFGSNILLGVILIALGFTVFIHLIKKIPLGVLSVFAIILFILILYEC